jgi:hypothetical protein
MTLLNCASSTRQGELGGVTGHAFGPNFARRSTPLLMAETDIRSHVQCRRDGVRGGRVRRCGQLGACHGVRH